MSSKQMYQKKQEHLEDATMNKKVLLATIERYKKTFDEHRKDELYKWEAVNWFQSHWSVDADDFHAMLKKALSKAGNLLTRSYFFAKKMITLYAEKEPEIVCAMFKDLFDDSQTLSNRIANFITSADKLNAKYSEFGKQHFQDPRSISVYLFLNHPDKYYLYIPEKFKVFAEMMSAEDQPKANKIESMLSYYAMCDKVLEFVLADTELIDMSESSILEDSEKCYQDKGYRVLTDDIVYYAYREYKQGLKDSEWWPSEDEYHPGIDTDQWKKLWANETVFTNDAKRVISSFLSFEDGATCKQVGLKFDRNGEFYNRGSSALAERIYKETECELPPKEKNAIWWPILYIGKPAGRDIEGVYIWKLRQELRAALEKLGVEPPLVTEKTKEDLENEFIEWFSKQSNNGVPYKKKYLDAIRTTLKNSCKNLADVELQQPNLFYQTDLAEFNELQKTIRNSNFYKSVVESSKNGAFSRGMDFYKMFLESRSNKSSHDEDYETPQHKEERTLPERRPRQSSRHQMNVILYGAPGTGKTYSVTEYAMAIIEDRDVNYNPMSGEERENLLSSYKERTKSGQIVFTTFHQSYSYEDFIQGLRPVLKSETMKFSVEDGVFKKISDKAMMDNDNNYVIIIDEINRANISRVFGELITLIEADKRWGEANELSVTLPSGDPFAIPNNLYIIGTMNSADKSISLIDTALRRRFDFIEIAPNVSLIENSVLRKMLKALNKELLAELDSSDLLIGHAYFINKSESDLVNIMNRNIIPLLYEYFHDNERKVKSVVSKAIDGLEYHIENKSVGRLRIAQGTI
jgi:5-methylcytosine-specific restriction protein B